MSQPKWRLVANLGDVNPLDYGGYFVYQDETGVYPPEAESLMLDNPYKEDTSYTLFRFVLERCTFVDGVLSDNRFYPECSAWFAGHIDMVASFVGDTPENLRESLCSDDPITLARAYGTLADYFGGTEFDHYPLKFAGRDEVAAHLEQRKGI